MLHIVFEHAFRNFLIGFKPTSVTIIARHKNMLCLQLQHECYLGILFFKITLHPFTVKDCFSLLLADGVSFYFMSARSPVFELSVLISSTSTSFLTLTYCLSSNVDVFHFQTFTSRLMLFFFAWLWKSESDGYYVASVVSAYN